MSIPAAVTTATVHHDAPVSFGGEWGRVMARFTPSASLIWEATGTPLAAFFDAESPENGAPLEIELPHTDQPGFLDGAGNTLENWHYSVKIWFFKDGQNISFPSRDFQLSSGQASVDLALIPWGEAVDPTVAPLAYVTSINGQTGDVEVATLVGDTGPAGPEGPEGPAGPAGPVVPLDTLTDVVAPSPSDGQALIWDAGTSKWVNKTVSTADIALDSITDVNATAPADGDALVWDEGTSRWVASGSFAATLNELTDVDTTGAANGKVLTHNGTGWVAAAPTGGGSGPTTVRATSSNTGNSSTASVTVPATAVAGDLLVISVHANWSVGNTSVAGWTFGGAANGSNTNVSVFSKIAVSGDPGSVVSFSMAGGEPWTVMCAAVQNAALKNLKVRQTGSGASLQVAEQITGIDPTDQVLMFAHARNGFSTVSWNAGSAVLTRTGDTFLSSTLWTTTGITSIQPTATSSGGTQGVAIAVVVVGSHAPHSLGSDLIQTATYNPTVTALGTGANPALKVAIPSGSTATGPAVFIDTSPGSTVRGVEIKVGAITGAEAALRVHRGAGADGFLVSSTGVIRAIGEVAGALTFANSITNPNGNTGLNISDYGLVMTGGNPHPGGIWLKTHTDTNAWHPVALSHLISSTKTTSYSLNTSDHVVIYNGSTITATLQDPTTAGLVGRTFIIKNIHSTALSVVSAGASKTIDGAASVALAQWDKIKVISDGAQWLIIEGRKAVAVSATAPTAPLAGDVWFDIS